MLIAVHLARGWSQDTPRELCGTSRDVSALAEHPCEVGVFWAMCVCLRCCVYMCHDPAVLLGQAVY